MRTTRLDEWEFENATDVSGKHPVTELTKAAFVRASAFTMTR